jgi:hypothetical protein
MGKFGQLLGNAFVLLAAGPLLLPQVAFSENVHVEWVRPFMSEYNPAFDSPSAMTVDAAGNAHVTGSFSGPHQLPDMVTIKYNSVGDTLWVRRFHGPGDSWDDGRAVVLDPMGNVYVTGWTHSEEQAFNYVTIKYSASGVQQWLAYYDGGGDDRAMDIGIDALGNVYITGTSSGPGTADDYATVKYNNLGEEQWVARYNGPGNTQDRVAALAIDAQGSLYVTGSSGEGSENRSDYVTLKYNPSGVQQWVGRYTEFWDYATAIDVDASANVYVTGYSYRIGTYYDYTTVKYNTMGVEQWVRRFNGPGTSDDIPYALKVDESGNVVVTGDAFFEIDHGSDYGTVKYSPTGVEQWVARYNGPGDATDIAFDLAIDESGDVYVTGGSRAEDYVDDFYTIKYSASGVEQWAIRHSDEGEVYDIAEAIGLDGSGGVYVTGSGSRLGGRTCTTIKYTQAQVSVEENAPNARGGFVLGQNLPNPFNDMTVIRYSLPVRRHATLKVYDVLGKEAATLVDGIRDAGDWMVEWDSRGIPSGVYFYRLQAGDLIETKRLTLLR